MLKRILLITILSALIAEPAAAARTEILVFRGVPGNHNILDNVALNASPAARTITLTLGEMPAGGVGSGYDKLRVFVFFTHSNAATVTALFSCSLDGTNFASLMSRSITSGASTLSVVTDTHPTGAADAQIMPEFDIRGCAKVQILFGADVGADANDLVDVQAVAIRGS